MTYLSDFISSFIFLFTEAAPFLLLGLLLAGLIRTVVPNTWIEKTLGKESSVITAAMIGAPVPLCSCSVIPTAIGIRRSGASKASTASFMVATPETGLDSIAVTLALMGPVMAIIRPIAAVGSAIITGLLVRWCDEQRGDEQTPVAEQATPSGCGGCKSKRVESSWYQKVKTGIEYGFGNLLGDFATWLLVGLFFAALVDAFVPESFFAQYGSGILAMVAMVVISIPMYICATASTPIAAGLMISGISPGAALVFMLAGPATNIATLMVVKNELGLRSLAGYLAGVIGSAIVSGLLLDAFLGMTDLSIAVSAGEHSDMLSLAYLFCALVLAALMIRQILRKQKNRMSIG